MSDEIARTSPSVTTTHLCHQQNGSWRGIKSCLWACNLHQLAVQLHSVTADNSNYVSFTCEFQLFLSEVNLCGSIGTRARLHRRQEHADKQQNASVLSFDSTVLVAHGNTLVKALNYQVSCFKKAKNTIISCKYRQLSQQNCRHFSLCTSISQEEIQNLQTVQIISVTICELFLK